MRFRELSLKAEAGGPACLTKLAHCGPQSGAALLALPQKLRRLRKDQVQRSSVNRGDEAVASIVWRQKRGKLQNPRPRDKRSRRRWQPSVGRWR